MKTLLNKKIMIVFAAILFCIPSIKAQIPDRLKNLPYFKHRASMLDSLHKPHLPGILHDMLCSPNAPCLKAQTTLGGSNYDQVNTMIKTRDGGYIVGGITLSSDYDFHVPAGNNGDAFLAKYNRFGKLEWTKTYGGTGDDFFDGIDQTYDGGYIVAGQTNSNDGDVSGNHGGDGDDVWVAKVNALGNLQWQKCFGGTQDDVGNAVKQTFYGGFIIAGQTASNDGDVNGNHNSDGNYDGWVFELSPKGNLLFQHCYGGSDFDAFDAMVPSGFGSYILEGSTSSGDGDVSGYHGGSDVWVVKINAFGKIVWQRAIGGSSDEGGGLDEITNTNDGNVVIDGGSFSSDGDIHAQPQDTIVSFIMKLSSKTGAIIWDKGYAAPSFRFGNGVFATKDGGLVEVGGTTPDGSSFDILISKFDRYGNEQWYKILGGSDFDLGKTGYETFNGELRILGQTGSDDGDVKNYHGNGDGWIIKLGRCGNYLNNDEIAVVPGDAIALTNHNPTIKLYPNPATDVLKVEGLSVSAKTTLSLFTISGKLLQQSTTSAETYTYSLQNLAAGSYYIKIQSGGKITTLKFVKQ